MTDLRKKQFISQAIFEPGPSTSSHSSSIGLYRSSSRPRPVRTSSPSNFPLITPSTSNFSRNQTRLLEAKEVFWSPVSGNLNDFQFTLNSGINNEIIQKMTGKELLEFYNLFFDDSILDMIVNETNNYAEQEII